MTKPQHMPSTWCYIPLNRNGKPPSGYTERERPEYWEGIDLDWPAFEVWVHEKGNTLGVLTGQSDIVVVDCDKKVEWESEGGSAQQVVRHGLSDLKRVAAELGETITPTFMTQTKSGGYHLFYQQHPQFKVTSKGHRDGWLIDVKASRNTFAVLPPSAGYSVLRDLPVAVMPDWLAHHINVLNHVTLPLGGQRMVTLKSRIATLGLGTVWEDGDTFERWVGWVLDAITLANEVGGWNNEIYLACRTLFDVGLTIDDVRPLVMNRAAPRTNLDVRSAEDTIKSAWRGHLDDNGHGYTPQRMGGHA